MVCKNCDLSERVPGKLVKVTDVRDPHCAICGDKIISDTERKQNNWDSYFLNIASVVASNSKCMSRHIGAILVYDKAIISTGYNGPPRGVPHCGTSCPRRREGFVTGQGLHLCPATHAEANCIVQAAKNGVCTEHTTMYLTCEVPCKNCLALIINAGIEEVVCTSLDYYDDLSMYIVKNSNLIIREYRKD